MLFSQFVFSQLSELAASLATPTTEDAENELEEIKARVCVVVSLNCFSLILVNRTRRKARSLRILKRMVTR